MAQQKIGTKFKRRRIPEGHSSPTDFIQNPNKLQTSHFEKLELNFLHTPKKLPAFLLLN
jgi:hypothetical protein